jgi:hypothetical protein
MDRYQEFTPKQQVVFYVVSTIIVCACVYFDFKQGNFPHSNTISSQSSSIESKKINKPGYEVAHSAFSETRVQ